VAQEIGGTFFPLPSLSLSFILFRCNVRYGVWDTDDTLQAAEKRPQNKPEENKENRAGALVAGIVKAEISIVSWRLCGVWGYNGDGREDIVSS
jgi:hypothetical protein